MLSSLLVTFLSCPASVKFLKTSIFPTALAGKFWVANFESPSKKSFLQP